MRPQRAKACPGRGSHSTSSQTKRQDRDDKACADESRRHEAAGEFFREVLCRALLFLRLGHELHHTGYCVATGQISQQVEPERDGGRQAEKFLTEKSNGQRHSGDLTVKTDQ